MDDVTLGMSGAADTLFISAMSGDAGLLTEQTRAIKDYVSSLHSMTNEVMDRYGLDLRNKSGGGGEG